MFRNPNTTVSGDKFDNVNINYVWSKAAVIPGYNPNVIKMDIFGSWIKKSDYGKTNSQFGWEIDHIKPVIKKGLDYLDNLQPLNWKNNRLKGDNFPDCGIQMYTEEQTIYQHY